ncbi:MULTISPECIES: DnaJ domain-containing protein [Desulfobacula]|uniref:DnaJ domain heat shock protein n=2 Tax=Desulfobacula TaxID=28222 RepID=K0NQU9_DESTT|nr:MULTISPECIES: DnaJ domain-containing protein [Desulfobacula]CCK81307.1 DnaJ domain heat shock protein [Desulfobacula toluolica Tol2]SDU61031.1 Protein of unknown function [Desulfobacula phenolica]
MNFYVKLALIIFALAYLISPVDIIPDLLLPYIGWIDDGVILGTIVYLIRYGRLPNFLFKNQAPFNQSFEQKNANFTSNKKYRQKTSQKTSQAYQEKTTSENIPKNPYAVLGIEPGASKKKIQEAYKEAIKKYHPDKVSHMGKEFSDLANKKFLEIQQAYDTLMNK